MLHFAIVTEKGPVYLSINSSLNSEVLGAHIPHEDLLHQRELQEREFRLKVAGEIPAEILR